MISPNPSPNPSGGDRRGPAQKTSPWKRVLFSLIVLFLLLGAGETILRLHDFNFYFNFGADLLGMPLLDLHSLRRVMNRTVDFDPYLFWRFKPNQVLSFSGAYKKPVHINGQGFRGPEFSVRKPEGTYRVIAVGDSTTFGWSVADAETYPARLSDLLKKNCRERVEVLNMGVTGYTSLQGRELLLRRGAAYQPDLVIFAFGPNDRLPALKSDREHLAEKTWDIGPVQEFLHRFQLYKLMKAGVVYLKNRRQGLSLSPATYLPRIKRKVSPQEFAENVAAVQNLCDHLSADLLLVHVDFPSLLADHLDAELAAQARQSGVSLSPEWKPWDGRALLAELGRKYNMPVLDLRELFSSALEDILHGRREPERALARQRREGDLLREEPWRYLMVDNGHPNEWGHEIIAAALREKILALPRFQARCGKVSREGAEP